MFRCFVSLENGAVSEQDEKKAGGDDSLTSGLATAANSICVMPVLYKLTAGGYVFLVLKHYPSPVYECLFLLFIHPPNFLEAFTLLISPQQPSLQSASPH